MKPYLDISNIKKDPPSIPKMTFYEINYYLFATKKLTNVIVRIVLIQLL